MQDQIPSNIPSQQEPSQEKKSSKLPLILLFVFTALFFGGLGVAGGKLLLCEEGTKTEEKKTCSYNDATYNDGDTFDADDGCNKCICSDGEIRCTEMACETEETSSDIPIFYSEEDVKERIDVKGKTLKEVFLIAEKKIGYPLYYPESYSDFIEIYNDELILESMGNEDSYERIIIPLMYDGIIGSNDYIIVNAGKWDAGGSMTYGWKTESKIGTFSNSYLRNEGVSSILKIDEISYHFIINCPEVEQFLLGDNEDIDEMLNSFVPLDD